MLGRGSVVPYIGVWGDEKLSPTNMIERPGGGIGYADETILDRDEHGVLWARFTSRIGVGKPLFRELHPARQRRAMRRLLCQVCAQPADRSGQGTLWLIPGDEITHYQGRPEDMPTIYPPVCAPCAHLSVRMCPALREQYTAIRAHSRLHGVIGVEFQAGYPCPRPAPQDATSYAVSFRDPAIAWVMATQLVRTLRERTVIDLERLP
jgi:hypothetical protein